MEEEDVWHEWILWRDLWNLGCRDCLVKWCKMQIYRALCFLICTVMALAVPQRAGRIVGTDHRSSSRSVWVNLLGNHLFPSVGPKRTAGTWKPWWQGTGLEDLFFWTYFQGFSPENLPGCKFRWSFWAILPFRWRSWGRPSIWFQKGRSVWQCWTLTTSAPASVGAWRRCWRIWSRKIMQAKMVKMTKAAATPSPQPERRSPPAPIPSPVTTAPPVTSAASGSAASSRFGSSRGNRGTCHGSACWASAELGRGWWGAEEIPGWVRRVDVRDAIHLTSGCTRLVSLRVAQLWR